MQFLNLLIGDLKNATSIAPLILKIKSLQLPPLNDYLEIFKKLPSNAVLSFLRRLNHKKLNLLSSTLILSHHFLKQKIDEKKNVLK